MIEPVKSTPDPMHYDRLGSLLKQWRRKLASYSIFGALPLVLTSQSSAIKPSEAALEPISKAKYPNRDSWAISCRKPAILGGHGTYLLPHQRGKVDLVSAMTGADNCPGMPIPAGTYTAAAPYTDTGNTTGGNDTVTNSGCEGLFYYYSQSHGPDSIYSFSITARGPDPKIEVTATSPGRSPYIYILDGRYGTQCPAAWGHVANNCMARSEWASQSSTATIATNQPSGFPDMNSLPLNAPLHLFIDDEGHLSGGFTYTMRMQDLTIAPAIIPPRITGNDFDGDGKADVSIFRPSDGTWYLKRSSAGSVGLAWGSVTDAIVPADYDRDGKTDVAIFRPSDGRWYILNSSNGTFSAEPWGLSTDIPVPGDYFNHGSAYRAIFRPSDGTWWIRWWSSDQTIVQFGQNGDVPVVADYDGDGSTDVAVFRPTTRTWFIRGSATGTVQHVFGLSNDKPIPADYDGDGKTDIAVYRPSEGRWYIANSGGNPTHTITQFGVVDDIPVPADYDGDGRADVAIFRPSDGTWWINRTTAGLVVIQWGQNSDKPIPSAFGN